MKFNGEVVPGSPWKCDILPPQSHPLTSSKKGLIKVHGLDSFAVGQTHSFDICAPGLRKEDIEINISGEFYSFVNRNLFLFIYFRSFKNTCSKSNS